MCVATTPGFTHNSPEGTATEDTADALRTTAGGGLSVAGEANATTIMIGERLADWIAEGK